LSPVNPFPTASKVKGSRLGAVCGVVAITPVDGHVTGSAAILIGLVVGVRSNYVANWRATRNPFSRRAHTLSQYHDIRIRISQDYEHEHESESEWGGTRCALSLLKAAVELTAAEFLEKIYSS
jgi:hypothetical protein